MGRAKSFTEMSQLNLYLPKWQVQELERLATLDKTTRSKLAHRIIAQYLTPTPPKEVVKPVLAEDGEWEEAPEIEINEILKF